MLLFAHTGITLGVTRLSCKAIARARFNTAKRKPSIPANPTDCFAENPSRSGSFATWIDYRLILLGSMLPDIIDKPLGTWFLRDILSNGRVFSHTLLFAVLLAAAGMYLYVSRRRAGLLCLSFGSIAHLYLDKMWLNPRTIFWPLYGWSFGKTDISHWLQKVLTSLGNDPGVYIPETIGALLLGVFLLSLIRQGKLYSFVRTGKVD